MCLKLVIHDTNCETRRPVYLQKIPRADISHFDIYHPFEEPRKCEHHVDAKTTDAPCASHGSCCHIYTDDVCDEMVHNGYFSCMGFQQEAHFVRTEAVLEDCVAARFCGFATRSNGTEMESSAEVFARLKNYLDAGAEVHEFLAHHEFEASGKNEEELLADFLEIDDPALAERWTNACSAWSVASSHLWKDQTSTMDDNQQRLCQQRGITPFWMEAFRIPLSIDNDKKESGPNNNDNGDIGDGNGGDRMLKEDVLTDSGDSFDEEAAEEYNEMMTTNPQPIYATQFTESPERNDRPVRLRLTSNRTRRNQDNASEPEMPIIADEDVDPDNFERETDYPATPNQGDGDDAETRPKGSGYLSTGGVDYMHDVPKRETRIPEVFYEKIDLDSLELESDYPDVQEEEECDNNTPLYGYLAAGNNDTHYRNEREYYEDMDYDVDEQDYWANRYGRDYSGEETIPEESEDEEESSEATAQDFEPGDQPNPNAVPATAAGGDGGDPPRGDDSNSDSQRGATEDSSSSEDESKDGNDEDDTDGGDNNGDDDNDNGRGADGGGHNANGGNAVSYSLDQEPSAENVASADAEDLSRFEPRRADEVGSEDDSEATTERQEPEEENNEENQGYESSDKENQNPNDLFTTSDLGNLNDLSIPSSPTHRNNTPELPLPDGIVPQQTPVSPPIDGWGPWHPLYSGLIPDRLPTPPPDTHGDALLVDGFGPNLMPNGILPDNESDEVPEGNEGVDDNEEPRADEEEHTDGDDADDERESDTYVYYVSDTGDDSDEPGPFLRPIALAHADEDIRWRPVNWTAGVSEIPWSAAHEVVVSPTDERSRDIFGSELEGVVSTPHDHYVTSRTPSRRATWPPEAIRSFIPEHSSEPLHGPEGSSDVGETGETLRARRHALVISNGVPANGNDSEELPDYESEDAGEPLRLEARIDTAGDPGLQYWGNRDNPHYESPEEDEYLQGTTPVHPPHRTHSSEESSSALASSHYPSDSEPEVDGILPHNIGAYAVYVPVTRLPQSPRLNSLKRKSCGEDHDDKWPSDEKRRKVEGEFRIKGLASSVPNFNASSTSSSGRLRGLSEVASTSDSNEPRGTKRKASEFDDVNDADDEASDSEESEENESQKLEESNADSEDEESDDDDGHPLSPPPREWKMRRLSVELRKMGSNVPRQRSRFF